jgi:hypothetical protein
MNSRVWLALAFTGLAATGCYPAGDEAAAGFSLRLSLSDLGVDLAESDFDAYSAWLAQKQQGLETTFELNSDTQKFFLGLRLFGVGAGGLPPAIDGESVEYSGDKLSVYLSMDVCQECHFEVALFWVTADGVETFTGTSTTFSMSGRMQDLDLDAYLHPVGSLLCKPLVVTGAAEAQVASLDVDENVQFPPVAPVSVDGTWQAPLSSIPVGRTTAVMIRQLGGGFIPGTMGDDLAPFESLSLDQAGQMLTTTCRP